MRTSNAVEILKNRARKNPELQEAYIQEKRNYFIACKIRDYRKQAGLNQKELAQLIGTKQSVISRLENAEYEGHSLSILTKIAEALHVPLERFLCAGDQNSLELTLHIPPILKEASSFKNYDPNQIVVKRSYAR